MARNQNTSGIIKGLLEAEDSPINQHVSHEFQKHREQLAADDSREKLLESLYFPDIKTRQEEIPEAYERTFEWIFDSSSSKRHLWHNFVEWLESGSGTYWISGKAGSGKSTLMNFICQDLRTGKALKKWAESCEILCPTFFFWNAGTELQKSARGLLRSLVYQIIEKAPGLMPVLTRSIRPSQHELLQIPTWSEKRLHETLQNLLGEKQTSYCVCIFIDGLDEFNGSHDKLLNLIRGLRQNINVKFCLSSRPNRSFQNELGSSAMLKLQFLTKPDIRSYVSGKLSAAPRDTSLVLYDSRFIARTANAITEKAEGVFLWVALAVEDQIEGIRGNDNERQLEERLRRLPSEIEDLYIHMFQKIDKVYWTEVARYIQWIILFGKTSVFELAIATWERIDDIFIPSPGMSASDICSRCKLTGERISTTCKGLLEVHEDSSLNMWQDEYNESVKKLAKSPQGLINSREKQKEWMETKFYDSQNHVDFCHRTALDFFKENSYAKDFMQRTCPAHADVYILYVKVLLTKALVFPIVGFSSDSDTGGLDNVVRNIMRFARICEEKSGSAQPALMDLIDRQIAIACQRYFGQLSEPHWIRYWDASSSDILERWFYYEPIASQSKKSTSSLFGQCSEESVPSVYSEPKRRGPKENYPVDFLGFAASHGLCLYVRESLDLRPELQNSSTASYLLCCVVHVGYPGPLRLIPILLERGADPNMVAFPSTVWGLFLKRMLWRIGSPGSSTGANVDYWLEAIRSFLEGGANVNEEAHCTFTLSSKIFLKFIPSLIRLKRLELRASVLWIIQRCFSQAPEASNVKEFCISHGASPHSRCTRMTFGLYPEEHEDEEVIELTLSEQESAQFRDTLCQPSFWTDRDYYNTVWQDVKTKMMELFENHYTIPAQSGNP